MMVYGDPQYRISGKRFLANFGERLKGTRADSLDDLRALLIQAGQFEQGMADAGEDHRALTDLAAKAFHDVWKGRPVDLNSLNRPHAAPDVTITVKIPEGYEFYGLYPEQYAASAEALGKERGPSRALVLGIRSIGTSLSAVVCATLNALGWKSSRRTVRPTGHPFQRQAVLPQISAADFDLAIIVDEGPGLSGSSVNSVCGKVREAGISDVVIFPGHLNGPGHAATDNIRAIWEQTEKRFTPAETMPFRDIGAGKWRELLSVDWPPAFIPFERPKYLTPDGVLWKLAGLGAAYDNGKTALELARERMHALEAEGFGPAPLETSRGFIAMPWIQGRPLVKSDANDPAVFDLVSDYVIRLAGLPLDPDEMRAGQERLVQMAVENTRETLGGKWAQVAFRKLENGRDLHMFQSYGDGRVAPHEWVRASDGRIFKVDCFGHDADHTLIGRQSIVWDIAGLVVEWELPDTTTQALVQTLVRQGVCLTSEVLEFYLVAYTAFKMGLCSFCAAQTGYEQEKGRLIAAERAYCHKLLHLLNRE